MVERRRDTHLDIVETIRAELSEELGIILPLTRLEEKLRVIGLAHDLKRLRPDVVVRLDLQPGEVPDGFQLGPEFDDVDHLSTTDLYTAASTVQKLVSSLTPAAVGALELVRLTAQDREPPLTVSQSRRSVTANGYLVVLAVAFLAYTINSRGAGSPEGVAVSPCRVVEEVVALSGQDLPGVLTSQPTSSIRRQADVSAAYRKHLWLSKIPDRPRFGWPRCAATLLQETMADG